MSDTIAAPTATEPETVPVTPAVPTPDAGASNPPAAQPTAPAAEPFAVFPDAKSLNQRLQREAKKRMNESARELGYDDWEHMQSELAGQRQTPSPGNGEQAPEAEPPAATPPKPSAPDEAARLRMALQVATEKNLPATLIARLQGATPEEMAADADQLLGLLAAGTPRGPGIPPVPQNNQTTTFTRAQLRDPAFVRANAEAIQRASREGRIVDA